MRILDGFASLEEVVLEELQIEEQGGFPEFEEDRPEIDWLKFCFEMCESIGILGIKAILADVLEARDLKKLAYGHLQLFRVIIELNRLAIQTKITDSVKEKLSLEEETCDRRIAELCPKPQEAKRMVDLILNRAAKSLEDD